ncbi:MAG TPA: TolC family protein, partial [Candidatus Kapabacteria bacterium]|nr:TolC family protein [Candidatus Kapabacteria bacterium]
MERIISPWRTAGAAAAFILTIIQGAFAQTPHASGALLDSLIAQALRNNPGIRSADMYISSSQGRIEQAESWDDPQAGIEFYATPVTSFDPIRDGKETDYFIQQAIPFPGKKSLMGNTAKAGVQTAVYLAGDARRRLILNVKTTYAMIYSLQRQMDVNAENIQLLQQIRSSTQTKYSVAEATQGDVLKTSIELEKLQNDSTSLTRQLQSAIAMMNALRGAPNADDIGRVAKITPVLPVYSLDSLVDIALDSRPDLLAMQSEVDMDRTEAVASEQNRLPDFMVRGTYKVMVGATDNWALMVGVNIPIAPWASGKYEGKIEEEEYAAEATLQEHHNMNNMIRYEVTDAWTKVRSSWEQIERYKQTILPQAEQALQSSLVGYQTNKTDFLSLMDSERMLNAMETDYYMLI